VTGAIQNPAEVNTAAMTQSTTLIGSLLTVFNTSGAELSDAAAQVNLSPNLSVVFRFGV